MSRRRPISTSGVAQIRLHRLEQRRLQRQRRDLELGVALVVDGDFESPLQLQVTGELDEDRDTSG